MKKGGKFVERVTAEGKGRWKAALLLALFLFALGIAVIPARLFIGDPYAWREEAINIILFHRLEIPDKIALGHGETNQYFTQNPRTKLWYSKYGIMSGLLNVVPLYFEYRITNRLPPWDSATRRLYLGVFYAGLGAAFGATLFLLCGHYGATGAASLFYVLFTIFCTYCGYYLRATNSEAYQLLFYTAFFERAAAYRASSFQNRRSLYGAWFFLLCLVHVKVSHLMVAGIFSGALLAREVRAGARVRELGRFLCLGIGAPMFVMLATLAAMNFWKFGSPVGTGYTMWQAETFEHNIPPWRMVWNVFFTQQWGVPVHFPLLFLAIFGMREFWRRFPFDLVLAAAVFLAVFVVIGSMPVWKGEWAYGPRYFLFALPALSLPALLYFGRFLDVEERRKPLVGALLAATVLVGAVSGFFQVQVGRLDPFFCYWARPNIARYNDPELTQYWNSTNFGWIALQALRHRDHPEDLWWMRKLKEEILPDQYAQEKARLEDWLRRTNFYWWSPRD